MGLIDTENLMTVTDIREDGTEITYVPYSEIESAPTAYDVDAVVKQLEEYREEMEQFGCSGMLSDMIEIVKGGGLDAKTLTDIRHIGGGMETEKCGCLLDVPCEDFKRKEDN